MGHVYAVHRGSIHPAMRVCKEWGSLLLNEEVRVVCVNQKATDWINTFFSSTNFMNAAQSTIVRAFGLGTGAWALWLDLDKRKIRIRHYNARMVIPLSWDEDGISECAFVTRAFYRGKAVDRLQMHLRGGLGFSADLSPSAHSHENEGALLAHESEETYRIVTVCFDHEGNELAPAGILPIYDTGCPFPTFGIVKPAVTNTRVDMSPYGQSVFADAVDAVQAVDPTFDALINEIDLSSFLTSAPLHARGRHNLEDVSGGVTVIDLGLNDFRIDLVGYHKDNPEIDRPPGDVHAVVTGDEPGVLFVLRNVNPGVNIQNVREVDRV